MPRNPVRLATAAASSMLVGGLLFAAPVAAVGSHRREARCHLGWHRMPGEHVDL